MFDWISDVIESAGYAGIVLLMLLENIFPPIPSELVMPIAGYAAAEGKLQLAGVIAAGTVGSLLGAAFWYYIGRAVGHRRLCRFASRHGRWLTLSREDVDRAVEWFQRRGAAAVFVGRMIPALRTLISVPAGIARMSLGRFTVWTALGTAMWTGMLSGAGYILESQHERVADYLNPLTNVVLAILVGWYVLRLLTFRSDPEQT
jgi:membrane protein DedA with SNARE-associated domain